MKYSEGFRNSVLRKVLPAENRSVYAVAKETGISAITIQSWIAKLKDGTLCFDRKGSEPTSSKRGAAEKLKLLLEKQKVADAERGEWLRQHGLHSEHLALYEQELEGILTDKQLDLKRENAELKKHIKELERELAHNQKAMAEALALLTLKKNHQRYFTRTRRTNRVGAENTGSGAHRRGSGKRCPGEKGMQSPRHLHKKLRTLETRYDGRQTQGGGKIGAANA